MKKIIFIPLMLISIIIHAQTSFVEIADGTNPINLPNDFTFLPNGNILFASISMNYNDTINTSEIYELSPEGEILQVVTLTDSTKRYESLTHILLVEDTIYAFSTAQIGAGTTTTLILMDVFDLELNQISQHEIRLNELIFNNHPPSKGQVKYIDGNFICMFSISGFAPTHHPFYAEISRTGELLNFAVDNETGYLRWVYDFSKFENNTGFQVYAFINFLPGYDFGGYMMNYDKDMNLTKLIRMPCAFLSYFTYLPAEDGEFYLAGEWWQPFASPEGYGGGIVKMKNDSTLLNSFLYVTVNDTSSCPAYRNALEYLPDGNIIFCCTDNLVLQQYPQLYPTKINLFKLTPDLEVIWHRYIGFEDSKNDAFVVRCNEDGEIVIFAALSPAPMSNYDTQLMFIKTDSDGLITGMEEDLHGVRSTEAVIYPNPARDFVHVEFSMAYTNAIFVLQDINGNPILETKLMTNRENLDLAGVLPGSYVYRIYNQKGLDERGKLVVGR